MFDKSRKNGEEACSRLQPGVENARQARPYYIRARFNLCTSKPVEIIMADLLDKATRQIPNFSELEMMNLPVGKHLTEF